MKKNKDKNGITLIALVITIIVLLILVAVTISLAINGGLFEYAKTASLETKSEMKKEQDWTALDSGKNYEYLIDKYTTEEYDKNGWTLAWTCTNGIWSGALENTEESINGDVIAKAYERGTVTIDGIQKPAYHLVIEKGDRQWRNGTCYWN